MSAAISSYLQLFEYLNSKEDFLGHLLTHLGTSAMMDLLMRLVTYDPMYETKAKILKVMEMTLPPAALMLCICLAVHKINCRWVYNGSRVN